MSAWVYLGDLLLQPVVERSQRRSRVVGLPCLWVVRLESGGHRDEQHARRYQRFKLSHPRFFGLITPLEGLPGAVEDHSLPPVRVAVQPLPSDPFIVNG